MGEVTACYLEQPVDLPVPLNRSFHLNPKNDKGRPMRKTWYQTWNGNTTPDIEGSLAFHPSLQNIKTIQKISSERNHGLSAKNPAKHFPWNNPMIELIYGR